MFLSIRGIGDGSSGATVFVDAGVDGIFVFVSTGFGAVGTSVGIGVAVAGSFVGIGVSITVPVGANEAFDGLVGGDVGSAVLVAAGVAVCLVAGASVIWVISCAFLSPAPEINVFQALSRKLSGSVAKARVES